MVNLMEITRFQPFLNQKIKVCKKISDYRFFIWVGILKEINLEDNSILIDDEIHGQSLLEVSDLCEVSLVKTEYHG